MIKIVVGAGLSAGLAGFVDAWKRAGNGDATEDRVLSFETQEALERYFLETRPADEVEAYRLWGLTGASGTVEAGANYVEERPNSSPEEKRDEALTIEGAVALGRASAATGQSKSHEEISAWLRTWGTREP